MKTVDAIQQRRSVKHYDPNHKMSETEINDLLSLAILSPTAFNLQNWRFVLVDDMGQRQNIRRFAWDQSQVTDASLLLVLCADLKAWEKEPVRYWQKAPQDVQDFVAPAIDEYYRGKDQVQRDEAMRSCGIVAQTIMLAAKSLEYDSCPMDGFDFEMVGKIINLPEDHTIAMMIAIGKGTVEAWERPGQLGINDVVVRNRFLK